jgi:diacylglycerol kinase (ATP)
LISVKIAYKFRQVGPIYYEYGSLIITYDNADIAVKAFYMLREASYEDRNLLVLMLPNISADMIPTGVRVRDLCQIDIRLTFAIDS